MFKIRVFLKTEFDKECECASLMILKNNTFTGRKFILDASKYPVIALTHGLDHHICTHYYVTLFFAFLFDFACVSVRHLFYRHCLC